MNLAETAKLIIQLDLKGNAAAAIKDVTKKVKDLDKAVGSIKPGLKTLGTGLGVAFVNGAKLAVGAIGGIVAGIALLAKGGIEHTKVQTLYANAIKNSGKVSTDYIRILDAQQTALMNLAGVDDDAVKAAQTHLITLGLTGDQVAKLTPLVLDLALATGTDLETAAKDVGRSLNGSRTSLEKYGISIDKAKFKTDPYIATLEAIAAAYKDTAKSLSPELDTKLKVFNENLDNIRDAAGIRLLPALTRLVDVAGTALVPAFGKFIDRVLPSLISGIESFAGLLENGGAERGIKGITDALGPMVELLKIAAAPVKAIVQAFLSLPTQVQGVLIGAFAVNKLSGGLVGQGALEIAKPVVAEILKRGGSVLNPLFVSDVQNRAPNGQFAPGFMPTTLGKFLNLIPATLFAGAIVAAAVPIGEAFASALPDWLKGPNGAGESESQRRIREGREAMARNAGQDRGLMNAIDKETRDITAAQRATTDAVRELPGRFRTALGGILFNPNAPSRPGKDDVIVPKSALKSVQDSQNRRGFASGAWDLGSDQTARVHKGEMIVPKRMAQIIRGLSHRGGGSWIDRDPGKDGKDNWTDADQAAAESAMRGGAAHPYDVMLERLAALGDASHPASAFRQPAGGRGGPFVPSVRLDASQIQDRRRRNGSGSPDDRNLVVTVRPSIRDTNTAQDVRGRWGKTPTQVGAA